MSRLLFHYLNIGICLAILNYFSGDLDEFTNYDDNYDNIQINNNNNIINCKI